MFPGNFLNNVAGQLWAVLPSTGNQMRHRAHDRSKVSRHTFVTYSEWESAQATLLKKVDPVYHQPKHYCKRASKGTVVYIKESAYVLTP